MKLKRLAPGHYLSVDGRVTIRKKGILGTKIEEWFVTVDGAESAMPWRYKSEAVAMAERELRRKDGQ